MWKPAPGHPEVSGRLGAARTLAWDPAPSRGLSRLPCRALLWPLKNAALGGLRGLTLPRGPILVWTRPPLSSMPLTAAGGQAESQGRRGLSSWLCPRPALDLPRGRPAQSLLTEGFMWPTRLGMLAGVLGGPLTRDAGAAPWHPANHTRSLSHQTRRVVSAGGLQRSLPA